MLLDCVAYDNKAAVRAGNGPFHQQQVNIGTDIHDFQIQNRLTNIAHVTRHLAAFIDLARGGAHTDGTASADPRATMARTAAAKLPATDNAGETTALRLARDVDELIFREDVGFQNIADGRRGILFQTDLADDHRRIRLQLRLFQRAEHGLRSRPSA